MHTLMIFGRQMHILEMFCMFWHFSVHINPVPSDEYIIRSSHDGKNMMQFGIEERVCCMCL
jgi:hypothetical protein